MFPRKCLPKKKKKKSALSASRDKVINTTALIF